MIHRKLDIQYTRESIGWAYHDMKWLSAAQADQAKRERNKLLQSLSGKINSHFGENKIGPGQLSPGCKSCGQGTWSCLFIGSLCTADCFYCPQDRTDRKNQPPTESGLVFDDPDDYVDYVEKFKFRGVSFSGGEPLLQYNKILIYIKKIRERLGNNIYIWLYTNGDLVDRNKLNALKKAGLNEIRFDVSARGYNLKPVKLAVGLIDTVTIEIPAIPEDFEILKRCLPRMKAIGVAHLNLHQMHTSRHCYREFVDRGYTFLHQPDTAVLESEMTALRLLRYAVDHKIGLAINYCSTIYKNRYQKKGYRERFQSFIKKEYEDLTQSGFIRRLSIKDTPANLKKLVQKFRQNKCPGRLWLLDQKASELCFHASLMKYADFNSHSLILSYFAPQLVEDCTESGENCRAIELNVRRTFFVERKPVYQMKIYNAASVIFFRELFMERMNIRDVLKNFYSDYEIKTQADISEMMDEKDRLVYLKTWEFIGDGLAEIY